MTGPRARGSTRRPMYGITRYESHHEVMARKSMCIPMRKDTDR